MTQEVIELIDTLSQRFGTTAQLLIQEMTKYYITIYSTILIITLFLTITLIILGTWFIKIKTDKDNDPDYEGDSDFYSIMAIFSFIFSLISGVMTIVVTVDLIGWLVSPTAAVIEKIMKMLLR